MKYIRPLFFTHRIITIFSIFVNAWIYGIFAISSLSSVIVFLVAFCINNTRAFTSIFFCCCKYGCSSTAQRKKSIPYILAFQIKMIIIKIISICTNRRPTIVDYFRFHTFHFRITWIYFYRQIHRSVI